MHLISAAKLSKFDNALRLLNNHLILENKARSTRSTYVNAVRRFIYEVRILPEEASYEQITTYLMNCRDVLGMGFATIKANIFALRYYLRHVCNQFDMLVRIPNPQLKKYDIEVLSLEELNLLFGACRDSRQLIIVQMLFETGVRISELVKIQLSDFDFIHRSINIRCSKNNVTRTVHFGETLVNTLKKYLKEFKSLFSGHLFFKKFHPFMPLSKNGVTWTLNAVVKRAGISKRVTPHTLRHAFAVHYINFGGAIYQLQRLLGHRHIHTTVYYLQYATLHEAPKVSPLDKLAEFNNWEQEIEKGEVRTEKLKM